MPPDSPPPKQSTTPTEAITRTAGVDALPPLYRSLSNHRRFGNYVIIRPLGRGGMGEVYEAEDVENGRRVALKLLRQSLGSERDRARFLREGRLAAAITHEHVVYVFGSEEIEGAPVITMELATGGNLKEKVDATGPLPMVQAVDAILQVIAGLEATSSAGVLHRDIKPSNCFINSDGSIKVGDFGLSISTESPGESQLSVDGAVLGTPAFASPEQVTGKSLDVRSDIYSTGATLYYLLTGRPPFGGDTVAQVIGNVLTQEPESPAAVVPGVSQDLSWVVHRCLAKDPSRRYPGYESVRRALLPFSSRQLAPAPLYARVLASMVDGAVLTVPVLLAAPQLLSSRDPFSPQRLAGLAVEVFTNLIYFGVLEGTWGASLGKWALGIRVVGVDQLPISLLNALMRASIWIGAFMLLPLALNLGAATFTARSGAASVFVLLGVLLLFVTARRSNGFAGLHDRLTRTRVVKVSQAPARVLVHAPPRRDVDESAAARIGPYSVIETLGALDDGHLVLGYDRALRRHVWIHTRAPGSPAVSLERRQLARPARLRWLGGRRTATENWDAYNAPAGIPFTTLVQQPQPWSLVRFVLHDLAIEFQEILNTGERLTADAGRIWITEDGGAVLLDFRVPAASSSSPAETDEPPVWTWPRTQELLAGLARASLGRNSYGTTTRSIAPDTPIPLRAREFLAQLERAGFSGMEALIPALQDVLPLPAELTRQRRLIHVAGTAAAPVAAVALALLVSVNQGAIRVEGLAATLAGALLFVLLPATYAAAAFRGGPLFQILGIAIVTTNGREASRGMALARTVVTWLPAMAFIAGVLAKSWWLAAVALIVMLAGLVLAVLTPNRGLQDRLLGTHLVMR